MTHMKAVFFNSIEVQGKVPNMQNDENRPQSFSNIFNQSFPKISFKVNSRLTQLSLNPRYNIKSKLKGLKQKSSRLCLIMQNLFN